MVALVWVTIILPLLSSCHSLTLKTIFQESKAAIASKSSQKRVDILAKYYFTTVKEKSVWHLAQQETMNMFGLSLDRDSLQFIETLLKRLASHYQHCLTLVAGVERSQCFSYTSTLLQDAEKGVRWHTDPDMEVGEKTKFGTLYNCMAAMSALVSIVAKDNLKHFRNKNERDEKIRRFSHVIYKMISDMQGSNEYDHDVVEFRLDQISPVRICDIKMHFWKEFEGSCETRWTTLAFDKAHKNQIKLRSNITNSRDDVETEEGDNADETEATIPDNDEDRNTVEDKGIDIAMQIGGEKGHLHKYYKAYVADASNDKLLYEKYFEAEVSSRGNALDVATKHALKVRGKEELRVKEDIMEFLNGTFYINMELLRNTLKILKR